MKDNVKYTLSKLYLSSRGKIRNVKSVFALEHYSLTKNRCTLQSSNIFNLGTRQMLLYLRVW